MEKYSTSTRLLVLIAFAAVLPTQVRGVIHGLPLPWPRALWAVFAFGSLRIVIGAAWLLYRDAREWRRRRRANFLNLHKVSR